MKKSLVIATVLFGVNLLASDVNSIVSKKMQEIAYQKQINVADEKPKEVKDIFEWKDETIRIRISQNSVNRIVLPAPITGKIYSQEKGVKIETNGNDAYIKVIPIKKVDLEDNKVIGQKITYDATETEVFFTTEKKTYSFVFVPDSIEPRTAYITDTTIIKEDALKLEKGTDEYVKNLKNIIKTTIDNKLDLTFTENIKNEKHDKFYYVSRAEGVNYVVHKFFLKESDDTETIESITKSITSKIVASATYENYFFIVCEQIKL